MRSLRTSLSLARLAYLLPIFTAVAVLVLSAVPCFFFQSKGEAHQTMNLFGVMANTLETCTGLLNGTVNGNTSDLYFSIVMLALLIVCALALLLYVGFALFTALLLALAWNPGLTHPAVNALKRAYRILVLNRGFFAVFNLLPLLFLVFPHFLKLFYNTLLGEPVTLHYFFLPSPIVAAILCAASVTLFFCTLKDQQEARLDLFRIYKL